jgi:hypothetical protein
MREERNGRRNGESIRLFHQSSFMRESAFLTWFLFFSTLLACAAQSGSRH